jgi:hypothetical protein
VTQIREILFFYIPKRKNLQVAEKFVGGIGIAEPYYEMAPSGVRIHTSIAEIVC